MRQIIKGKIYDTDKSELIYRDNDIWQPRIYYRTQKGTFFCHYKRVGRLDVISDEVMMEILAEKDPDKYIELFGAVEEG